MIGVLWHMFFLVPARLSVRICTSTSPGCLGFRGADGTQDSTRRSPSKNVLKMWEIQSLQSFLKSNDASEKRRTCDRNRKDKEGKEWFRLPSVHVKGSFPFLIFFLVWFCSYLPIVRSLDISVLCICLHLLVFWLLVRQCVFPQSPAFLGIGFSNYVFPLKKSATVSFRLPCLFRMLLLLFSRSDLFVPLFCMLFAWMCFVCFLDSSNGSFFNHSCLAACVFLGLILFSPLWDLFFLCHSATCPGG